MLPLIMKKAMILVAVCLAACGIIAFCAGVIRNAKDPTPKLRIGYVAEDNLLTEFAVSYVQDMASIQSLCSLEAVAQQEGEKLLEEGVLSALIVLPDDVINEILSGTNAPAKLYLPAKEERAVQGGGLNTIGGMLFEELVSAGMGMLDTAQAQIYASSAVLRQLAEECGGNNDVIDGSLLQSMYDDINKFNLGVVTAREDLFQAKSLSLTGNDTYAVYYGSAFLTIYVLLAGLFFGNFCKRSDFWQKMTDRRIGVGYTAQLFDRCLAGGMLMLVVTLIPFLVFVIPQMRALIAFKISTAGTAVVILILIIAFMTIYYMMIYQMVEKRESAIVVIGILALFQAYMAGCLIPSVLLPNVIVKIGRYLPASFVKKGFTAILAGETKALSDISDMTAGLTIWGLALFGMTIVLMHKGEHGGSALQVKLRSISARIHVPSVAAVLFRRLLHKKSIWLSLGVFAVLSVGITQAEKKSETQIKAAVCDESGDYEAILENYDGLIGFELYEDREQVMDAVRRGNVECGYVLPRNLAEDMAARKANQTVTIYQDEDAVAVPIVNEVIFERIFRQVSLEWYIDYIVHNDAVKEFGAESTVLEKMARDCFEKELSSGTTFQFEIERIGTNDRHSGEEEKEATYPIYLAAAIAVALCVLQGVAQVMSDIRNKNFYKRNRIVMSMLTVMLPALLGISFAAIVLAILFMHTGTQM